MPTFSPTTPTADHKFNGLPIAVPYVYAEGSVLSAPDALAFNRFIATAVGNAWGAEVRRELEALDADRLAAHKAKTYTGPMDESGKKPASATVDDLYPTDAEAQAAFNAKFTSYVPGAARQSTGGTSSASSTFSKFITNLATAAIKNKIAAKGWKVRDFQTAKVTIDGKEVSKFNALVTAYITNHPELEDQAKAQIAANETVTDDMDLDLPAVA